MSKFKVGDIVKQIEGGSHTAPEDNYKEAIVTVVGGRYLRPGDGIKIKGIGTWDLEDNLWRGEDAFELASRDWDE